MAIDTGRLVPALELTRGGVRVVTSLADDAASSRPSRGSSESFGLLRSALIMGLVLAIPTYLAVLSRQPLEPWHPDTRLEIHGDSWDGNLATDGQRVFLMTREEIDGFWGVLYVRSSGDGGRTWGDPVQVSTAGGPSAARHTLTVGPDGSLWAAWSQLGAAPSTQQLVLRRSRDEGRTWEAPLRASPPAVGLVGLPALEMTPDASFVAVPDGERGTVLVQPLDADGATTTEPTELRATTRELYGDPPFLDAGIGAAALGDREVVVIHDGTGLWRMTSGGPGQPWVEESWYVGAAYGPPRLAAVSDRLTALASIVTGDGNVQISSESSSDGGRTWDVEATWLDPMAGDASRAVNPDQTAVLWESCDPFCSEPTVRLGAAGPRDGRSTRIDGAGGRPAGAILTDDTLIVAWIDEGPDFEAEDRTLVVATGPRP